MLSLKEHKKPLISIFVVAGALIVVIAVGFTIGFLSTNPDGLERMLIDANGEEWLESLPVFLQPIFGWLENEYIVGILGMALTVTIIVGTFYTIGYIKKKRLTE